MWRAVALVVSGLFFQIPESPVSTEPIPEWLAEWNRTRIDDSPIGDKGLGPPIADLLARCPDDSRAFPKFLPHGGRELPRVSQSASQIVRVEGPVTCRFARKSHLIYFHVKVGEVLKGDVAPGSHIWIATQAWRLNSLNLGVEERYDRAVFFLSKAVTREKLQLDEWPVDEGPTYLMEGGIEPERFQRDWDFAALKEYLVADRAGRLGWAKDQLYSPTNWRSAIWELEFHDLDEPGAVALALAALELPPIDRLVQDEAIYLLNLKSDAPATAAFFERAAKDKSLPAEWRKRLVCCLDTAHEGHAKVEAWLRSDDPVLREGAEDARAAARAAAEKVKNMLKHAL